MTEYSGKNSEEESKKMAELITDNDNWVTYFNDGIELWLKDYPHSEMHGGGPSRLRKITVKKEIRNSFKSYIESLAANKELFETEPKLMKVHMECLLKLSEAYISNTNVKESLETAKRAYGWSFLPGEEGKRVETIFWHFANEASEYET